MLMKSLSPNDFLHGNRFGRLAEAAQMFNISAVKQPASSDRNAFSAGMGLQAPAKLPIYLSIYVSLSILPRRMQYLFEHTSTNFCSMRFAWLST